MSNRFLFFALRTTAFACLAISMFILATLAWSPRVPDSNHLFLYKQHYLSQAQVIFAPGFLIGFAILVLASEFFRKVQPQLRNSKYFW